MNCSEILNHISLLIINIILRSSVHTCICFTYYGNNKDGTDFRPTDEEGSDDINNFFILTRYGFGVYFDNGYIYIYIQD